MPPVTRLTVAVMIGQQAKDQLDKDQAELTITRGRLVTQSEVVEAYQEFWNRHAELRQP